MYLSCLLIDVGTNPDRPRPGRLWLRNLYRVHQRLCMAFPSADRKRDDPQFLQPHAPGDFAQHHVHTKRSSDCGFLFRIDPQPGANPVIVVQSADRPDWEYAFHNARHFLAAPPEPTPYNPQFLTGQVLKFRLLANPVRRASPRSSGTNGQPLDPKWVGKHIPVPHTGQAYRDWLVHRAEPLWSSVKRGPHEKPPGFSLSADSISSLVPGYVYFSKKSDGTPGYRLRSVRYEGELHVTDPNAFLATLRAGIGPAKGLGFGLLSVAPALSNS